MMTMMDFRCGIAWFTLISTAVLVSSLPTSLVDEIKASELRENNKVKRARPDLIANSEERNRDSVPYYSKPTAIKRGGEQEWEQADYQNPDSLSNLQAGIFNDNIFDDKAQAEYEKTYHYGTSKDKLDEALENALLKSELYGEPSLNQFNRYYGEDRRRRRRDARKIRLDDRMKREVDLTPDELLELLLLREQQNSYNRSPWQRLEQSYEPLLEKDDNDVDQDDENWLDTPVYPHASARNNDINSGYYYDEKPQIFEKRGRWGAYSDRAKRFMVSKKRSDPTRELRYLNGPSKNDYYALSELLSNQREPNVPVYHRLVL